MKRSTLWTIIGVLIVALGGGGAFVATKNSNNNSVTVTSSSYTKYMKAGKNSAKKQLYQKAAKQFDKAYKIKPTKTAQNYHTQAKDLQLAISYAKNVKYSKGLTKAKKARDLKGGYKVMTDSATKLVSTLKEVKDNYDSEIKPLINKATQYMNDKNYDKAANTYTAILNLPYIGGNYYKKIRNQIEKKLTQAKKLAKESSNSKSSAANSSESTATSSTDTSNSSASSDSSSKNVISSSSNSEKSQDSNTTSKNEAAGSSHDDHVGGATVTLRDTQQIRNHLKSIGVDTAGYTPQDLIDIFRYAYDHGHTSIDEITKSDVKNASLSN